MSDDPHDHFGPDCPQCQAASQACQILGGFAEALERMIADGTFERLGAEMAQRREEAFWQTWAGGETATPWPRCNTAVNSCMATIRVAQLNLSALEACSDLVCTDAMWAKIKGAFPALAEPREFLPASMAVHTRPTFAECDMLAQQLTMQGDGRRVLLLENEPHA